MTLHHTANEVCLLCESKLETAHPFLAEWFRKYVKPKYALAHVSWAYRGEKDQEKAYSDGKTKLHFPNSPHNHTLDNQPQSLALDLFEIDEDGVAEFHPKFYSSIYEDIEAEKLPIAWGGMWHSLGDGDHFQYTGESAETSVSPSAQTP